MTLIPTTQCIAAINFEPGLSWPSGLPAVAINNVIFAGFHCDMAFNNEIPFNEAEKIADLFKSLYPDLSFAELVRFSKKSESISWIPTSMIQTKYGFQVNAFFKECSEALLKQSMGFQKWCESKKVGPQDLAPLLSSNGLDIRPLQLKIISLNLSKSEGIQALEIGIDLLLMGHLWEELKGSDAEPGKAWINHLTHLRYPQTFRRDQERQQKWQGLPWPGTSQARWVRQGDRAGVELKIFVSQPSDLKKHLVSLQRVQEIIDQDIPDTSH